MNAGRLAYESYLDATSEDVERIAVAATAPYIGRAVPACPGWTVSDVLVHLTGVYDLIATQVSAADPVRFTPSRPRGPGEGAATLDAVDAAEELERAWHTLLGELAPAGPAAPCWNFTGADLDTAWVARRMAHETSVHRVDVESATGRAGAVERELAVDGIAEALELALPRALARARGAGTEVPTLGGSLCLVATDVEAAFVVELHGGSLRWRRGRSPADAVVAGLVSDLFLFCWRRAGADRFQVTGDRDVLRRWADLPTL